MVKYLLNKGEGILKKFISILLCAAILVSSLGILAAAQKKDETPVIFVPGFLQPYMYIEGENGAEDEYLWLPKKEKIFDRIIDDMPNFLLSIFGLLLGDVENFGETLGGGAYAVAEKMRCNPDGSSVYPVVHYKNDPAESNAANLKKIVSKEAERKNLLFESFIDYAVANGYAELENIFIFEYDSRFDPIVLAEELRDFIKAVKKYTGSEKVNLFTVSYGGLITSTYLYYHMNEKDIGKAVLNVPPLQGTDFPDRLFRQNVDLPLETLVDFVESVLGAGTEVASIFEANDGDFLNTTLNGASGGMLDVVRNWSTIYAITSTDLYEGMKKDFLDPVASKAIIKNNDIIHYEIMPAMKQTFEKCKKLGTDISIIACTGIDICLGGSLNGDILVPTYSASGATVAELGKRFADGYTGKKTSCSNPAHNHVSPSMEVDASTAFLPENTWFIEDSYHAMFELEDYAISLAAKLVFTDELKDVHSDPAYPQFEYSNNPHRGVYAKFNNSLSGYVSSKDTALIVENIFDESIIKITSVVANGMEIDFDIPFASVLKPGEKLEIPFSGDIPKVGATRTDITVNFVKAGISSGATAVNFPMTINNGKAPEYKGGFVDTDTVSGLEALLPDAIYNLLVKLTLRKASESIFDTLAAAFIF